MSRRREPVVEPLPPHPPRGAATSPRALEWKKRVDRALSLPLIACLPPPARDAPPRPPQDVAHVVFAKLWGVGNLAMILPLAAAARRRFPRARLSFLTLARNEALLATQPGIDAILTVREEGWLGPARDLLRATRTLKAGRVDLFVDFEQFLRVAGWVGALAGARFRVGFDTPGQARARLYHRTVPCPTDRHMAEGFAALAAAAGIPVEGVPSHGITVDPAACRALAAASRGWPEPWLVLHPGSGDNFPGRRWPVERFAAAAVRLRERHGGTLLVTGSAAERPLARTLVEEIARAGQPAISLAGASDLPALVALLSRAALLLSNDTGPVHLADAVGTPVVALFGPNAPDLYGPRGPAARSLYEPPPCSPCLTNGNGKSSDCRLPLCILRLAVDPVVAAAEELLAARPVPLALAAP